MFKKKVRRAHARCVCGWKWPKNDSVHEALMNYPVPCGNCEKTAYVVKHEDEIGWIRVRNFLLWVEMKGSLLRLIRWPQGYEEEFVYLMTGVTFFTAYILSLPLPWFVSWLLIFLLAERVVELTLVMLSVAFVSRGQRDIIRTLLLWLLNYFQVVVAFGCFYWWLFSKNFKRPLNSVWDSIYLSLVTITTLGDTSIHPISRWPKILIGLELIFGVILVAAILSVLIGTIMQIPPPKMALTLRELKNKSRELGKNIPESTNADENDSQ
jgi:hypothetical protein